MSEESKTKNILKTSLGAVASIGADVAVAKLAKKLVTFLGMNKLEATCFIISSVILSDSIGNYMFRCSSELIDECDYSLKETSKALKKIKEKRNLKKEGAKANA